MSDAARIMLRGLDGLMLRDEGKLFDEGRRPGAEKRFGVTKVLLVGRER